jgi:hypothetical protein
MHLPRDKKDRSVRAQKHDPYKAKGKLPEPSVCRQCKVVYHKGRWTWGQPPPGSHEVLCPACERIRDDAASGVLLMTGDFVASHRQEVLGLARNEEARVKAESIGANNEDRGSNRSTARSGHYNNRPPSRTAHWRKTTSCPPRHVHLSV